MGLVAAIINRLFGGKKKQALTTPQVETPVFEKLTPNAAQLEIMESVKEFFEGTNIALVGFDLIYNPDIEKYGPHVMVLVNDEELIKGLHLDYQEHTEILWTQPWDEDQNGEEGRGRKNGSDFCTHYRQCRHSVRSNVGHRRSIQSRRSSWRSTAL
jgi:hypothetical protein